MTESEDARRARIVSAISDYGDAVMENTKRGGAVQRHAKRERIAARKLLGLLFPDRAPTEEEIDQIIPG